jgi:hypothetical protein
VAIDQSFVELNRTSTERIRTLAASLSEEEMQQPVGEHWTPGVVFAHLAFWERRILYLLDMAERDGDALVPDITVVVNDLSLPLWKAIPPQAAAQLALEASEEVDRRLETFPAHLLEKVYAKNKRWVVRALHRNEHLDEVDAALKKV